MIKAESVGWHPSPFPSFDSAMPYTACTIWPGPILGRILTLLRSELLANPKEQCLMTHEKTNMFVIEIALESKAGDLMIIPYSWFELMPNILLKEF